MTRRERLRLRVPAVLTVWAVGLGLGALTVGCGLILGVDYDDAAIKRRSPGALDDAGPVGECVVRACGGDECGLVDDGCNGVMVCSDCTGGSVCTAGRCRCASETCADRGAVCGTFDNGCGGKKALECGVCTVAQEGCTDDGKCRCQPRACPDGGPGAVSCGTAPSGCGERYVCGIASAACPDDPDAGADAARPTCGGGGQNLCGTQPCLPVACTPAECGKKSNGCDDVIDCGNCEAGVCGANGVANQCGCEKATCARLGRECGSVDDGCGGTLECNACEAPEICSPSGTCGCTKIEPAVACAGKTCGYASDGCRSFHACGPACPDASAPTPSAP